MWSIVGMRGFLFFIFSTQSDMFSTSYFMKNKKGILKKKILIEETIVIICKIMKCHNTKLLTAYVNSILV